MPAGKDRKLVRLCRTFFILNNYNIFCIHPYILMILTKQEVF